MRRGWAREAFRLSTDARNEAALILLTSSRIFDLELVAAA